MPRLLNYLTAPSVVRFHISWVAEVDLIFATSLFGLLCKAGRLTFVTLIILELPRVLFRLYTSLLR